MRKSLLQHIHSELLRRKPAAAPGMQETQYIHGQKWEMAMDQRRVKDQVCTGRRIENIVFLRRHVVGVIAPAAMHTETARAQTRDLLCR